MLFSIFLAGMALAVSLCVVASMLRWPVLRRISLRNVTRRKWNTALVVAGSMVGTALISGSLVLNDSTASFQENEARKTLGEIDEVVSLSGQRVPGDRRPVPDFDPSVAEGITSYAVRDASLEEGEGGPVSVDGSLGVLAGEVPAESLDEKGSTVIATPAVTVVGPASWEGLRSFGEEPPPVAERPEPRPGELYASEGLAEGLELSEGSRLRLVGSDGAEEFTVAAVVPEEGISGYEARFSSAEGRALVNEEDARGLFGAGEGRINAVFLSNDGGVTSGEVDWEEVAGCVEESVAQDDHEGG